LIINKFQKSWNLDRETWNIGDNPSLSNQKFKNLEYRLRFQVFHRYSKFLDQKFWNIDQETWNIGDNQVDQNKS
jgi:hypothetical protein